MSQQASMAHTPASGTLHGALLSALQNTRTPSGPRTFSLTTLRSQPYRSYSLFPQATDQSKRVWKEDVLVLLAEQLAGDAEGQTQSVPVYGLEATLYTVPATSTCLLYISKVDTTGLAPSASPARVLTTAFISFHLAHSPRSATRVRFHTFARAAREGQYLFPGSVDNIVGGTGDGAKGKGAKRLLDDKQLIRWWKSVLTDSLRQAAAPPSAVAESQLRAFYLLPGFDYPESLPLVPPSPPGAFPYWVYGHPYSGLPSPLSDPLISTAPDLAPSSALLSDLIPAFSDDPKARFLSSLASSNLSSSGEVDDWDDFTTQSLEPMTSASVLAQRKAEMEATRKREKVRVDRTGADEFWERMGARQECSDGRVSAFFVVAREPGPADLRADTEHHGAMQPESGSVPRNVWVALWSQFHNVDYSSIAKASSAFRTWSSDVGSCVLSASVTPSSAPTSPSRPTVAPAAPIVGAMTAVPTATGVAPQASEQTNFEYTVQTVVTVHNPVVAPVAATAAGATGTSATVSGATTNGSEGGVKRPAEEAPPTAGVTMLQPKKKKPKPAPAPAANGS